MTAAPEPPLDDLGHPVPVARPARRVVSLVPSLTESVATARPEALVGVTDWCTHPPGLQAARVRGTKNPNLAAIAERRPDIVLANQEENRRLDVDRLRAAGIPVWVTVIRTLDEAVASLRRMFTVALGWPEPDWLAKADQAWQAPAAGPRLRAVIPVWRDPWMVAGSDTFTGDLAARLGLDNVYRDHAERYPHVTLEDIAGRQPDCRRPARRAVPVQPHGRPRGLSRLPGRARRGTQPYLVRAVPPGRANTAHRATRRRVRSPPLTME